MTKLTGLSEEMKSNTVCLCVRARVRVFELLRHLRSHLAVTSGKEIFTSYHTDGGVIQLEKTSIKLWPSQRKLGKQTPFNDHALKQISEFRKRATMRLQY